VAARLDSSYPVDEDEGPADGVPGQSAQGYRQGATFSDVAVPQDRYREVEDYSGEFPLEPRQLVTLSIAGNARNLIIEATELAAKLGLGHRWDPYEAILKPLTGDWAGLRACKDVCDNTADAIEDMSRNLDNGVFSVPPPSSTPTPRPPRSRHRRHTDLALTSARPKLGRQRHTGET
jgi:hypothetical protein